MNTKRLKRLRLLAFRDQHGRCYWCGERMLLDVEEPNPRLCTAEHLVERSQGGATNRHNIVAACSECNNGRSNFSPDCGPSYVAPTLGDLLTGKA